MKKNTEESFEILYAKYERRLFGFILSYVKSRQDAEEIFQDTFISFLSGNDTAHDCEAWLFTIARNACLNHLRSRRISMACESSLIVEGGSAEDKLVAAKQELALSEAVQSLPPRLAKVYSLRADGESYEGIAQRLSIPIGTVRSRVNALVQRLRKDLKPWLVR